VSPTLSILFMVTDWKRSMNWLAGHAILRKILAMQIAVAAFSSRHPPASVMNFIGMRCNHIPT